MRRKFIWKMKTKKENSWGLCLNVAMSMEEFINQKTEAAIEVLALNVLALSKSKSKKAGSKTASLGHNRFYC